MCCQPYLNQQLILSLQHVLAFGQSNFCSKIHAIWQKLALALYPQHLTQGLWRFVTVSKKNKLWNKTVFEPTFEPHLAIPAMQHLFKSSFDSLQILFVKLKLDLNPILPGRTYLNHAWFTVPTLLDSYFESRTMLV